MKKLSLVLSVFLLLFCAVACNGASGGEPEHFIPDASTPAFDTLEEMEDFSDLIIRGVRQPDEEAIVTTYNGNFVSGYTFSSFLVTDVYKDSTDKVNAGDVISILENEVYDKTTDRTYHIAGYRMMVEDCEYLLFLEAAKREGADYYVAAGVNFGTISLQDDNRNAPIYDAQTKLTFDIDEYDYYSPLWRSAVAKYIEN